MAMLAGIGDPPDTVMDRAIVIRMRRRAPGEQVAPFRSRRDAPPLNSRTTADAFNEALSRVYQAIAAGNQTEASRAVTVLRQRFGIPEAELRADYGIWFNRRLRVWVCWSP